MFSSCVLFKVSGRCVRFAFQFASTAMSGESELANVVTFVSNLLGLKVKVELGGAERRQVFYKNNEGQEIMVYQSGDPSTWRPLREIQLSAEEFERFLFIIIYSFGYLFWVSCQCFCLRAITADDSL